MVSDAKTHPFVKDSLFTTILLPNKKDSNKPYLLMHSHLKSVKPTKEWVIISGDVECRPKINTETNPKNRRKLIDADR